MFGLVIVQKPSKMVNIKTQKIIKIINILTAIQDNLFYSFKKESPI